MSDRIIAIEKYWTRVVRDTAEFRQIAIAENPELNDLLACIHRVLQDAFINDATEYGVSRWEQILELSVPSDATLEERKIAILTYLSIRRPYSMCMLQETLNAIVGEGNYTTNIDNDTSTMTVTINDASNQSEILNLMARILPQNLVLNLEVVND